MARYENPIPSRVLIDSTIRDFIERGHSASMTTLARHFSIDDAPRLDALSHRIKAMVRDGELIYSDDSELAPATVNLVEGVVSINPKGFGFVVLKDMPDLFLHQKQMSRVFDGDTVLAKAVEYRGKTEARIQSVLKQQNQFVGKLSLDEDGEPFVALSGANAHQPITLTQKQLEKSGASIGQMVRIDIIDPPTDKEFATGKIGAILDEENDRELIITTTIYNHNLPHEFSAAALHEADSFSEPSTTEFTGRVDLRDLALVTIDGVDSRDFDDAVYAEKRAGGNYRVVVAIADVSHYVKTGSALDIDAYDRGTSVYFPHHVIPMLPEKLSNGLCSLNPKVDRLCMVADMKISRGGRVSAYEFYPAVMHSKARLTYDEVNQYLANPSDATLAESFFNPEIKKSLDTLHQLYLLLDKKREERGAMAFETAESYIKFGENGDIQDIVKRTRGDAHKLIEECMLLANTCAAKFTLEHDLPVLYRNHERPDGAKSERLSGYLKTFGIAFPSENPSHEDYQRAIEATKERPDAISIHSMLLRSMMQANYSPNNIGHFGLAYEEYSHFTSPIRRYPDLMLHRAIKEKVTGKSQGTPLYANLGEAGEHTSTTERRAEEASRFVEGWLKCHYMSRHVGEEFDAVVSGVTNFGLFATLSDLFIDGLVHISTLGAGYFHFDEKQQKLIGEHGQEFALGQAIKVKVMGVNMDLLQIDFAPIMAK